MPTIAKGPRLWLRKARRDPRTGTVRQAVWLIRDGSHDKSTGCGADDLAGAEKALTEYLNRKASDEVAKNERDPAKIPVAAVIDFYSKTEVAGQARSHEVTARFERLLAFFGDDTLADLDGDRCRAYMAHRGTEAGARRDLEDLRAAINYHRREGRCRAIIDVVLPEKSLPRERWLTRTEVARLIWHAWRYREIQKGVATDRFSRRHVAKFVLSAVYTCTRKTAVCTAALGPAERRPFVDLDRGVFYRKTVGVRATKKRQPAVPVPPSLLAHMRRWHAKGQRNLVEWNGQQVLDCDKAFAASVKAAGLGDDVVPHTLRHTGITWLAQEGVDPYEIIRFAGITMEVFEEVYAHHHPDYMDGVRRGFKRHRGKQKTREPVAQAVARKAAI
jgi:integrase